MKKVVNSLRVPNVEPKAKSTTINLNVAKNTTNFKKKKNTTKNGDLNNSKNVRMNSEDTIMKLIGNGSPKTRNTWQNGPERASTLDSTP